MQFDFFYEVDVPRVPEGNAVPPGRVDESGAEHWKESNAAADPVPMGHASAGGRTFDFGGDQPDFDFDGL